MAEQKQNQQQPLATIFAPWVEWRQERCSGGRLLLTAVNHRDGQAMYLDPADIDPRSGDRYEATLVELSDGGFIEGGAVRAGSPSGPEKPPGAGLVWRGADRYVRRCHAAGLRKAFDRSWIAAQVGLAFIGALAFAVTLRTSGFELRARPGQVPAIIILGLVAIAIHELGHALVTVHYGRRVRMVGVRLHLGTPAFYVDSVDALLLDRRQRLIQAAAGPWAEWLVTSVVAIGFVALPHDVAGAAILHRFVIINTIVILTNLLPFVGLDGAMLLADATRQPDLPYRAQRAFLTRKGAGRDRWLTAYASANTIVAAALLATAGFFWWQLFGALGSQLWALGPIGVAMVVAAVAATARQILQMVATTFPSIRPGAARLRRRIAFRVERRWRVRAITAFRTLPGISDLDASELGILAGQLHRVCVPGILGPNPASHISEHRPPHGPQVPTMVPLTNGTATGPVLTQKSRFLRRPSFIALPESWQQLLTNQ